MPGAPLPNITGGPSQAGSDANSQLDKNGNSVFNIGPKPVDWKTWLIAGGLGFLALVVIRRK